MSSRRVVWKYPVGMDRFSLSLPMGAQVLCAQKQYGTIEMWVLVDPDPDVEIERRHFLLVGTGHEHDVAGLTYEGYVGTFQVRQGTLVFHLFELKEAT